MYRFQDVKRLHQMTYLTVTVDQRSSWGLHTSVLAPDSHHLCPWPASGCKERETFRHLTRR